MNNDFDTQYMPFYQNVLRPTAVSLENLIREYLAGTPHIDRIVARAKHPDRFEVKARKRDPEGNLRYPEPLVQIQDLVGARVVVFYRGDVESTEARLMKYFRAIEQKTIVPDSEWTFGYFGRHAILALPPDAVPNNIDTESAPAFFELQIKTLFQHAWSEAEHDLGYKPPEDLTAEQQRYLAYTSAQAWGADHVFQQLVEASANSVQDESVTVSDFSPGDA
jgi:putative GTP pyrophosphokinase